MGTFLILLEEKDPRYLTDALLSEHIEFLRKLKQDGRLVICGPLADQDRAMLIIRANSRSEAEALIRQDPFIQNKYYQKLSVQEFTEANEQNNWLAQTTPQEKQSSNSQAFTLTQHPPKAMSILFRKLKDGKTYEDFQQAWLPPVADVSRYFDFPILVIHAQNLTDPTEVLSIGLIWADFETAAKAYAGYQSSEELRQKNIEEITSSSLETRVAKILDIDVLGTEVS